ncbi:MAG TPA: hypothetical protein VMW63_02345 [Methanoregulaceae archaeon]|nr:hypothetical protein [Methanoregulaceae archaeon]
MIPLPPKIPLMVLFIAIGYLIAIWPSGYIIGRIISRWHPALDEGQAEESLRKAGRWIGYLERVIIITFVLLNQYLAIGLLVTAKSIFRFEHSRKTAEYYLLGTLLSLACGLLIGVALQVGLTVLGVAGF